MSDTSSNTPLSPVVDKDSILPLLVAPLNERQPLQLVLAPPGYAGMVYQPPAPVDHVAQLLEVYSVNDLTTYLGRMVTQPDELAIFINNTERDITAVLDYHPNADIPKRGAHVVGLDLALSPEFEPIAKRLGQPMEQGLFVSFLELNAHLFQQAAALTEMAENFSSVQILAFKKQTNAQNGLVTLVYDEKEDGERTTKVPTEVKATMPVFAGRPDQELTFKLRYRRQGTNLMFVLEMPGYDALIQKEFDAFHTALSGWLEAKHAECPSFGWDRALLLKIRTGVSIGKYMVPGVQIPVQGLALPPHLGTGTRG
jgi:Uncharacterized conserved protein (DUF2303)